MPKEKKVIVKRAPRTVKERKFVQEYIENGGNKVKAVFASYDVKPGDYNTASTIAAENIQKLTIPDLFDLYGITDEHLVEKMKNGLNATKVVTSYTEPDKIVEDFSVQHSWWKDAMKIKGHLKEDKGVTVNNLIVPILRASTSDPE